MNRADEIEGWWRVKDELRVILTAAYAIDSPTETEATPVPDTRHGGEAEGIRNLIDAAWEAVAFMGTLYADESWVPYKQLDRALSEVDIRHSDPNWEWTWPKSIESTFEYHQRLKAEGRDGTDRANEIPAEPVGEAPNPSPTFIESGEVVVNREDIEVTLDYFDSFPETALGKVWSEDDEDMEARFRAALNEGEGKGA